MAAPEQGPVPLLAGRLRDPAWYVLALIAFGLGGGGGWLVSVEGDPPAGRAASVSLLRQELDGHVRQAETHTDSEKLRALVQGEIDRSLRPIERELSEIRATLHRVQAKLDRALSAQATRQEHER